MCSSDLAVAISTPITPPPITAMDSGTCLNEGCIPTKALLHSAEIFEEAKNGASAGVIASPQLDFSKVMENKEAVVSRLVGGVNSLLKANGVKVIEVWEAFLLQLLLFRKYCMQSPSQRR